MQTKNSGPQAILSNYYLIFLLSILFFVFFCLNFQPFKVDDAYISFVYAKNLIHGNGLSYNGMVVEGYSNFLWTIIISPFIGIGMDPLLAARLLSIFCVGIALFLLDNLLRKMIPGIRAHERFLALLSIALCTPVAAWAMGGLETVFLGMGIVLFLFLERQPGGVSKTLSVLVVFACALTRPEAVLLFPVLIFHRVVFHTQKPLSILKGSLLFVVPYAAYLLWRHSYYGYWLPNTAYLKLDPTLTTMSGAFSYLASFFELRPLFALLVVVGILLLAIERSLWNPDWSLVGLIALAFCCFVLYAGADWMPHHRFLVPVIPLLALFIGKVLSWMGRRTWKVWGYGLAVSAIVMELVMAVLVYIPYSPQLGDYMDGLIRGGEWIRAHTSSDVTIAVVDAGALAYYGERRTIDIVGLNNAQIAHAPARIDTQYVLEQKPKVVQLHIAFTPEGDILPPKRIDHNMDLFSSAEFQAWYIPFREGATDSFFPFFFLRNTEPSG